MAIFVLFSNGKIHEKISKILKITDKRWEFPKENNHFPNETEII